MEQGLIERLTSQVGDRNLALNILRKRGHVEPNSEELTSEGKYRESLGQEGRALDRAVKEGGGRESDYSYNYDTNKTKLRP